MFKKITKIVSSKEHILEIFIDLGSTCICITLNNSS